MSGSSAAPLMRLATFACAISLLAACDLLGTPKPTATPALSPTPTATEAPRPRLELSTYQYALQTKGKIRVAVKDDDPPMSKRTASGGYEGFEPDLARELAKAIWGSKDDPDSHIEWISVDNSTRTAAITSDQADISIAQIVATEELRKVIDLSDTYLKTGQRLLVKKTNDVIKETADVASGEQTVCAVKDSVAEQTLRRITNDRAKILSLATVPFCLQALASGAADAFTGDDLMLMSLAAKDPTLKLAARPITEDRLALGIKKNVSAARQGFLEFINGALLHMVADRTWARLYEKDVLPLSGLPRQIPTD